MEEKKILSQLIDIIGQFVQKSKALKTANMKTHLIDDLEVNSAWIVDFIIKIEDTFDIEIDDDSADSIETLGDAVKVIRTKLQKQQVCAA